MWLFLPVLLATLEDREQQDDNQAYHHPEGDVLVDPIHARKYNTLNCRTVFHLGRMVAESKPSEDGPSISRAPRGQPM